MKATTTQTTKVRLTRAAGRVVIGSLVCAASVMCAPDALAQTAMKSKTVNQNFTTSPFNPCTNEVVNVEGKQTIQTQVQPKGQTTKYTFKDHQNGRGVGPAPILAEYQYEAMSQNMSVESTTCAFYVRTTSNQHLVRKGNRPPVPDDFFTRSRYLLKMSTNCQAELTVESFDAAVCK